jgi:microsomal dipeptidase-like Zn-dependent dipeptidase
MNELGILIDITHGTEAVHLQLIEASRARVVASRAADGGGVAEQVDYVIKTLGADHVGLGLDLVAPCRRRRPAPDLLAQLRRITSEANVRKIAGENWLRVLAAAKVG